MALFPMPGIRQESARPPGIRQAISISTMRVLTAAGLAKANQKWFATANLTAAVDRDSRKILPKGREEEEKSPFLRLSAISAKSAFCVVSDFT